MHSRHGAKGSGEVGDARGEGGDGVVVLELDAIGDASVARWAAERQGDLFARAFGAELTVEGG